MAVCFKIIIQGLKVKLPVVGAEKGIVFMGLRFMVKKSDNLFNYSLYPGAF